MMLYGAAMFLSAFLLFQVQPLIGKYVLPWFGGSPAVWTTCMLFFQALLLGGYAYAHFLVGRFGPKRQSLLHLALLAVTILALPIIPSPAWKPIGEDAPALRIMGLLLVSIGAPYFMLSSTAPLLQSWFSRAHSGSSPYRLYSLSNLGALIAILTYPILIEPAFSLHHQALVWSLGYGFFVLACGILALRLMRLRPQPAAAIEAAIPDPDTKEPGPPIGNRILWLGLTACSSIMLLATTSQLCQDVAVIPLLWVLPLTLYLASFIICFQNESWYSRPFYGALFTAGLVQNLIVLFGGVFVDIRLQILSYSIMLFASCMVCHGELVRLKPGPRHLTSFYLMIAGGGALGGLFTTFAAPALFNGYWEYHLGLGVTALLMLVVLFRDSRGFLFHGRPAWAWSILYFSFAGLLITLGFHIRQSLEFDVETTRNFFGVLRVLELEKGNPEKHRYTLMHGRIEHGYQFLDPDKRYWPTSYFGPESGVGLAIRFHPRRLAHGRGHGPLRIGVVGLGAGTLATYGEQNDVIRFYEINPEVVRLSDKYFTYRKDTPAHVDVVLGDARISLEKERQRGDRQRFDVLAIDAFSSDAIPVHLLTRECFETYFYHLKDDGILAIHISNRYFQLSPVVRSMVDLDPEHGMQALLIETEANPAQETDGTEWVLLTANQEFLANEEVRSRVQPWDSPPPTLYWTDDYSNLFALLRR